MLKLLSHSSSSCLRPEAPSPFLRVLGSLTGLTRPNPNLARRAFFGSDANNGDGAVEIEFKGTRNETQAESNSSSAIMPTNPNPEDFLTVGFVGCSFALAEWSVWINITECSTSLLRKCLHFCIVQIQMFVCGSKFVIFLSCVLWGRF